MDQMKLSTKSRYGTRILLELARHRGDGPLQVSEISRLQKIPAKYLEQLIRTLQKARLVKGVRGPKGGHVLTRKPEEISLGQVVRLFETQSDLVECVSSPNKCERADACDVRNAWQAATQVLFEKLDAITIADLISRRSDPLSGNDPDPPSHPVCIGAPPKKRGQINKPWRWKRKV
jgi:Rrf2 family transcriptional regulator, iron-sulfur cluster assembly transcription factor